MRQPVRKSLTDILAVPIFMILILSGIQNEGRVQSALKAPLLVHLGNISFSLYMAHGVVDEMVRVVLSFTTGYPDGRVFGGAVSLLILAGMLIFVFALSDAIYRRVEVPGRRWLKSWSFRTSQPASNSQ